MRLDKLLANRNYGSRKQVKQLCKNGDVLVNNQVIKKSDHKVSIGDVISVYAIEWVYNEHEYIVFNKPSGCVSANFDNLHPTVFEYLPEDFSKTFHIVGRLDVDTEGLMIITNDGQFIHRVISPNNKVAKVYFVKLKNKLEKDYIEKFAHGITISDGYKCMSATLEIIDEYSCRLTLFEGKFHQVKKMFQALNNQVVYLKRLSIGKLELGDLQISDYYFISKQQIYDMCIEKDS